MSLFSQLSTVPNPFGHSQLPSVQLALDGKPIYLRNFKAEISFSRIQKDMSGQKSSTKKSDKGTKAKKLKVSGTIPYVDADWLKTLMQFAEAVDEKNEQKVYRIANHTAEVMNMRQGVFSGEVSVVQSTMQAWEVYFELSEVDSVAEKKEQRAKKPQVKVQGENKASSGDGGDFWGKLDKKDQ